MADGSITFDTKIDTTGVSDGIKELKKKIADLQRGYDSAAKEYGQLQKKLEETPNDSGLKKQAATLEKYLNDAGPKLEDMKERLENMKPLEGPAKDADKLAAKLTGIYDSMQKMMELGTDPMSKAFQSKKYDADETAKELDRVYAEMNSMSPGIATDLQTHLASLQKANQEAMSQFTSSFTMDQDQKNLQAEIMKTADDLDALAAKQQEYQKQGIDPQTDKWKKNQSNIDESKKKLDELLAKLRETNAEAANGLQSIADSEYKNLKAQASKYASDYAAANGPKIQSPSITMPDISGKMAKNNAAFKVGLKHVLQYSLGIRSLFFLFRKLRSAMSEGLKNLAQFNGGVNAANTAMSSITSSANYL
ncbi:MAG: hypothetical protein MR569_05935, partial [Dialister sp.]|nr:hypothetical protein [Dialister sp.]